MEDIMNKKVCVVTGGTRGIGFATVKAFLNAGYQVVLYGSRQETVDKALEALKGEAVEGRWTNLQEVEAMKADFEEIKAKYGPYHPMRQVSTDSKFGQEMIYL